MKEFEDEAIKNNKYTEKIIKTFNSILIIYSKIFLNSLEEKNKRIENHPKKKLKMKKLKLLSR